MRRHAHITPRSALLALTVALAAPPVGTASAGERVYGRQGYGSYGGYGAGGYGFVGNAVDGAYLGAPLTRFPTPSQIVPPTWTYGTYGVPTLTGIRQAPVADPKIYVIRSPGAAGFGPFGDAGPGGPRVVPVVVPRR